MRRRGEVLGYVLAGAAVGGLCWCLGYMAARLPAPDVQIAVRLDGDEAPPGDVLAHTLCAVCFSRAFACSGHSDSLKTSQARRLMWWRRG